MEEVGGSGILPDMRKDYEEDFLEYYKRKMTDMG